MIKEGDVGKIGNERLRGLQKILPDTEDVSVSITKTRLFKYIENFTTKN